MPIFCDATAWEEYGKEYAVHKSLWRHCFLATLGPQPDKGDKARDLTVYRNHGTLVGAAHLPTWLNDSYRGQSFRPLTCDGTEDYVDVLSSKAIPGGSSARTFSCWVKWNANTQYAVIVDYGTIANYQRSLFAVHKNGGYMAAYGCPSGGLMFENYFVTSYTKIGIATGAWYHVAMKFQNRTEDSFNQFFINGFPVTWYTPSNETLNTTPTTNLRICGSLDGASSHSFSNASYADLRIYARMLTASEIRTLALGPLEAYWVRLPEYFTFTSTPSAGASPWLYDHGMVGGMTA